MGKMHQRVSLVHNYGRKVIGSKNAYCHQTVAETAQEMCGAVYDEMAKRYNNFYALHPSREAYVAASWGLYVAQARETLAEMLGKPLVPEEQKEVIYEALVLDKQLSLRNDDGGVQIRWN